MSADDTPTERFVSRGGLKLAAALDAFQINPVGLTCADLGSSTGGFVDCLLQRGATRVYAVERGYGVLDYRLRRDPRVVVLERTNALTLTLPEPVALVTVDTGWTRQRLILPAAARLLSAGGCIVTLIKPHYESDPRELRRGTLPDDRGEHRLFELRAAIAALGLRLLAEIVSPIRGHGGNREWLWHLAPTHD